MAASGHFLFELIKIAILSICYAGLMMLIGRMLFGRGYLKFGKLFCIIYTALFIFMFTYYGDHGLGDESNLPIGHWKIVKAGDGYPYFEPTGNKRQIQLKSFLVNKETLCAQTGEGYIAYDLVTDKLSTFLNQSNYDSYAAINNLPSSQSFKLFDTQYTKYWSGWRFWMLP
nr:hypothetical protein [Mucilaginibacter sp. L294]